MFVDEHTPAAQVIYTRMVFDTVSAALLAAHGTDAGPEDILHAARSVVLELT